jgi:hypothetical protein
VRHPRQIHRIVGGAGAVGGLVHKLPAANEAAVRVSVLSREAVLRCRGDGRYSPSWTAARQLLAHLTLERLRYWLPSLGAVSITAGSWGRGYRAAAAVKVANRASASGSIS